MADNSSKKFKFVSPGVFIDEIDQSQLPATPTEVGPVVIGRARKGPANKPVRVESFSDFVQTFGDPVAGNEGGDAWREGNNTAPTYAAYAAKAWLRNNSPLTFMRVLGDQDSAASGGGLAGYSVPAVSNTAAAGGVYALVVFPSGSVSNAGGASITTVTGAVAAQFYMESGRVVLSGTSANTTYNPSTTLAPVGNGCTLLAADNKGDFLLHFTGSSTSEKVKVSLDPNADNFIRKALNTNPTITNSSITSADTRTFYQDGIYWLGESFEYSLFESGEDSIGVLGGTGADFNKFHAAIFPMVENSASAGSVSSSLNTQQNDFNTGAKSSTTGWFIAQDLSTNTGAYYARNQQKLFRLEALTAGEWAQREIKISISNIKAPQGDYQQYGSFSVLVRDITDTDNRQVILERFDDLNLNPADENYIARRIGTKHEVYNATDQRNVEYGEFENRSNYVRVVMSDEVAAASGDPSWLPFGVWGPLKYRNVGLVSGSSGFSVDSVAPASGTRGSVLTMLDGNNELTYAESGYRYGVVTRGDIVDLSGLQGVQETGIGFSAHIHWPSVPTRTKSTWGDPKNLRNTFWGAWTGRSATDTFYNPQLADCLRLRSLDLGTALANNPSTTDVDVAGEEPTRQLTQPYESAWVFSLDNVSGSVAEGFQYDQSYRRAGTSITAVNSTYSASLDLGIDRFTTLLHGGFDGFDITEREPFRNSKMEGISSISETNSYELFSLRKAINIISDPDDVQMNAVVIPGITEPAVTNYLLEAAEDRGDAIAIIDIPNAYTPDTESTGTAESRNEGNTPTAAADALASRSINNSYGATYYPWVRIVDSNTNQTLWVPPSVAALGVLSNTDRRQAPWFAPAGFTRGGLSEGAAGLPVVDVSRKLTSDDRDKLYENNINPIAKFPAEGIVIFGQKTLQQTASALDRINVRRLMIFLKREISFIASRLLFAPNAQATWDRFLGQAEPVLRDVKAQFGIDDFRLILDESTTTPDLIDRNIIYAKLYVKPTRAVEYFAIDFIITNSGASFED
jgi:hypothetical protein